MSGSKIVGFVVAEIIYTGVKLAVVLFLIKIVWEWTVPGLFPGAVEQDLVAKSISWLTALSITIFIYLIQVLLRPNFRHLIKSYEAYEASENRKI